MAELRYNPLLDDFTMVSKGRAKRPDMPKEFCPFDPGSGKVPDSYDVLKYDNDFPMLMENPPEADDIIGLGEIYKTEKSFGKCEVILYSPNHTGKLYEQSDEHLLKLANLWQERYEVLSKQKNVKYVFIFENKGAEVGTTMPHPHGQIYAYPFVPLRMRLELENSKKYYEKTGKNIFDTIIDEEKSFKERIIMEDEHFIVIIPFFSEYPFGTYIIAKESISSFSDFNDEIKISFMKIIKKLTASFDLIYNRAFPYMMGIYNLPVNEEKYSDADKYHRFHLKFFPPLRGENAIKYNASSETAAWAHGNPLKVEDCAELLRKAVEKYEGRK